MIKSLCRGYFRSYALFHLAHIWKKDENQQFERVTLTDETMLP